MKADLWEPSWVDSKVTQKAGETVGLRVCCWVEKMDFSKAWKKAQEKVDW